MRNQIGLIGLFIILFPTLVAAQATPEQIFNQLNEQIDAVQKRIDLFDLVQDRKVDLKNNELTDKATETYLTLPDKIQVNISVDKKETIVTKANQLRKLLAIMEGVNEENYLRYNGYFKIFDAMYKVQEITNNTELLPIMSNHLEAMLKVVPFYENKSIAPLFLKEAAHREPRLLMQAYKEFEYQDYAKDIIAIAIDNDPDYVKNYLGSFSSIYYYIKGGTTPLIEAIRSIYQSKGSSSKAYVLSHQVADNKLTVDKADELSANDDLFFKYLVELRTGYNPKGEFSLDHELEYLSLKKVRLINELHDEIDSSKRFKVARPLNSKEIYALIVYTEDEIFTSTFLGLFDRMVAQIKKGSGYEFLFDNSFVRYRRFLKMCAGYGVLPQYLAKMSDFERNLLLRKLTDGMAIDKEIVRQCAAVADIYANLTKPTDKNVVLEGLQQQLKLTEKNSKPIVLLEEMLQSDFDTTALAWLEANKVLKSFSIFKDGNNIQQHFFYNDPDGKASYNSFLATYRKPEWTIKEFNTYVVISSKSGKKVIMYANKPESEYDGQDAIKAVFVKTGQWPDFVVHRGHSFYVQTSLESVTPATKLVILGSCGGYRNVINALGYAPDAFIISTRQVGTMLVNDELIYTLNEWIRTGKDIQWEKLWKQLSKKFNVNRETRAKFEEYIAPDENLGALYVKRYNQLY
jgi:hypothetical protein